MAKAFQAVGIEGIRASSQLTVRVVEAAEQKFGESIPGVEDIQDIVEKVLIEAGYAEVAKAYVILHMLDADRGPTLEDEKLPAAFPTMFR